MDCLERKLVLPLSRPSLTSRHGRPLSRSATQRVLGGNQRYKREIYHYPSFKQ